MKTRIFVLNTGGTLGMVGKPLRPAKSAAELLDGVSTPDGVELTLEDFESRQDSTNINHSDRVKMAEHIAGVYGAHDAFVILHGTDSLAETCAIMCMVFKRSLQKPLFVIGAQMTKDEVGSDVAMQIANTLRVCRVFHRHNVVGVYNLCIGDVWDGSRIRKRAEADFNAFHTPGRRPVAKAWPQVMLTDDLRRRDPVLAVQGLRLDKQFERNVVAIRVSADTPPEMMMAAIDAGTLNGVILECKGAGQIPDRIWEGEKNVSWIDVIKKATSAGVHVGIISPFEDGRVILDRYELGQKAADAGAIGLASLTPDMGDVKFRQAIAMHPNDPKAIAEFVQTSLVGELLPGTEDIE